MKSSRQLVRFSIPVLCCAMFFLNACQQKTAATSEPAVNNSTPVQDEPVKLPAPTESHITLSKVIGWPADKTPVAPEGFEVRKFADGMKSPRWIYAAPNGDIFVALANTESKGAKKIVDAVVGKSRSQHTDKSANQIILFQGGDPNKKFVFLSDLNQPLGMLILNEYFYVANTDALVRYAYKEGATSISSKAEQLVDLPGGRYNNHWTRNIIANAAGTKIYITVGSGSNVAEHGIEEESRRANILEINPDGTGERVFASGLRNPVGMDWEPATKILWTAVNERDELGDELVPDYLTSVKESGFYGWPYSYFGNTIDSRIKPEDQKPELVARAIAPDVALGSHTASLGLAFYDQKKFPVRFHGGAFIGQHGSWNHSSLVGYKVVFVPFADGKPNGTPEDFLTGFIANPDKREVYGRPVGVSVTNDGALLIADDASDTIWKVTAR